MLPPGMRPAVERLGVDGGVDARGGAPGEALNGIESVKTNALTHRSTTRPPRSCLTSYGPSQSTGAARTAPGTVLAARSS
jgi:hypothetical protein